MKARRPLEPEARTPSTKAVLEALRALQSKINRLEVERSRALDEATGLRLKYEMANAKRASDDELRLSDMREKELLNIEQAKELGELKVLLAHRDDQLRDAERRICIFDACLAASAAQSAARDAETADELEKTRARCLELEFRVESLQSATQLPPKHPTKHINIDLPAPPPVVKNSKKKIVNKKKGPAATKRCTRSLKALALAP